MVLICNSPIELWQVKYLTRSTVSKSLAYTSAWACVTRWNTKDQTLAKLGIAGGEFKKFHLS